MEWRNNNKKGTRERMNEFENVTTDITHSEQRGKISTKKEINNIKKEDC